MGNKFYLLSLGCAKNTVDSASMGQLMIQAEYRQVEDPADADVIIVNTCGFIEQARNEAYETLQALADAKRSDQLLVASGCLTQRYGAEVVRRIPGVDGILGTRRWMDIVDVIRRLRARKDHSPLYHLPESSRIGNDPVDITGNPITLRGYKAGASAYLKISDGCNRTCSFCAIPLIKGPMVSRSMQDVCRDAVSLYESGTRELNLIAQDTTAYGQDLGLHDGLTKLLTHLIKLVPDLPWIRILYAYPGYITENLIHLMAENPQILPYIDLPLQHAHPSVLARMGRPTNTRWIYRTIQKLRDTLPDLAIRTTFIVGFPGETETEFRRLLDFISEIRFDRVGTFQFSFEPGTASEAFGDTIPPEVKEERYQRLMELQQGISLQINQTWIGRKLDVLVEGHQKGLSFTRSFRDAPEIDGLVIVDGKHPKGKFLSVHITGALEYDLVGHPA